MGQMTPGWKHVFATDTWNGAQEQNLLIQRHMINRVSLWKLIGWLTAIAAETIDGTRETKGFGCVLRK